MLPFPVRRQSQFFFGACHLAAFHGPLTGRRERVVENLSGLKTWRGGECSERQRPLKVAFRSLPFSFTFASEAHTTPTSPPERRDLPGRPLPIREPSGDRLLFVNSGRGYVRDPETDLPWRSAFAA